MTITLKKTLVANRGEIAVRVIRAARDAGIRSVAVYAEPDRDALFVRLADEAHPLGGDSAAETYLSIPAILRVAAATGADSVHPGYGFLAENTEFAQAVIDAGLVWIGPPPAAIETLGDKVSARHLAEKVGAPLAPGTSDPVGSAAEVEQFAREFGLPVAIKAAFGGGGRGLKVVRDLSQVAELYDSAVREAEAAFGRGECFVERFLDRPRHVETQCLADSHGNVVVVSTRDCSLQRRHQKLVEEAPAPFLTDEQNTRLYDASKALLRAAGYVGAGTCEFLVAQDGTIAFLEVNTRLQVEHCVSEEVTGIDLVREMFRIAAGDTLGYDDPPTAGHSLEFRINAEDAAHGFVPTPGTITRWHLPAGPGVRVDAGYESGETVPGAFDSLIAKLIVTGKDRTQALERARRALAEFEIEGMPTVIPFHRAVVDDSAFVGLSGAPGAAGFGVFTTWIETEFDNQVPAYVEPVAELTQPAPDFGVHPALAITRGPRPHGRRGSATRTSAADGTVTSMMQGTVVKVLVEDGDLVAEGETLLVIEAMKMEQALTAPRPGTVVGLTTKPGDVVTRSGAICEIHADASPSA
jgi:acetyl-CoA/propionyl-CoA carboxylase biotin carboxyl carrier protein